MGFATNPADVDLFNLRSAYSLYVGYAPGADASISINDVNYTAVATYNLRFGTFEH